MAKKKVRPRSRLKTPATTSQWKEHPTAVVTGASSGIGREFALLLAEREFDLVLVGRDTDRLTSVAQTIKGLHSRQPLVLSIDLGLPGAAEKIYAACAKRSIVPEILINNAGFGLSGPFVRSTPVRHLEMLHVNVVSLVHLTRLFLPSMLERRRGYVLNVASTAGFQPGPLMASYYASKAYVISLSVALAREVKGSGVMVSVLCPGPTKTEFQQRAEIEHTKAATMAFISARRVAEIGYRKMLLGKTVIIPGTLNKIGSVGVRLLPLSLAARIVERLHQ
jgi:uncharacterized protein